MRKHNATIIFLVILSYTLPAQIGPVSFPEFINLQPAWTYKYVEPSIHPDSTFDRHISIDEPRIYKFNNDLILFTSNVDQRNITGSTIINLDPMNGGENCRMSNNHFTQIERWEYYNNFEISSDGCISMYGVQSTNPASQNADWSLHTSERAKFKFQKVNISTCSIVDDIINDTDTIGFSSSASARNYTFSMTNEKDRSLAYLPNVFYFAKYVFVELDSLLSVDSTSLSAITYFDNNPDSFQIENEILFRGDNYILTFVKQQNHFLHFEHPERSEVLKINFEDLDDIHIEHSLDITEISYDEFFGLINPLQWHYHLDKNNDNLLLNRAYLRSAGSTGWIVWMDKQGNIKTNFHNVAVDGHEYYFFQKITITDEYCDLLAFPTSSGHEGYDVIRITIDGDVTKHGEMVTAAGAPEFIAGVSAQQIGDKVIVAGRPTPRYNLVVYGFEAEDLGLGTVNTKDQQWAPHATKLTAYPNPATDYISVPLPEGVIIDQYQVVSYDAKIQLTNSDRHKENILVKVHQLANGLYLLRCTDSSGKMYTAEFIKQ